MLGTTFTSCLRQVRLAIVEVGTECGRGPDAQWHHPRTKDAVVAVFFSVLASVGMAFATLRSPPSAWRPEVLLLVLESLVPLASVCLLTGPSTEVRRFGVAFGLAFAVAAGDAGGLAFGSDPPSVLATARVMLESALLAFFGVYLATTHCAAPPRRRREECADSGAAPTSALLPRREAASMAVVGRLGHFVAWMQAFLLFAIALDLATDRRPHVAVALSNACAAVLPAFQEIMIGSPTCARASQLAFVFFALSTALAQLVGGLLLPVVDLMWFRADFPSCLTATGAGTGASAAATAKTATYLTSCLTLAVRTYVAIFLSVAVGIYSGYSYL